MALSRILPDVTGRRISMLVPPNRKSMSASRSATRRRRVGVTRRRRLGVEVASATRLQRVGDGDTSATRQRLVGNASARRRRHVGVASVTRRRRRVGVGISTHSHTFLWCILPEYEISGDNCLKSIFHTLHVCSPFHRRRGPLSG